MPELPAALTYGYVVGRYLLAVSDTTRDTDRLPDPMPASGSVRFRPVAATIRSAGGPPTPVIVPQQITVTIDAEGNLVDATGAEGVWLVTGAYDVSFSLGAVALPTLRIYVRPEHTESAPLDLGAEQPLVPAPGEVFVVNEAVRRETLAARDEVRVLLEEARRILAQLGGTPAPTPSATLALADDGYVVLSVPANALAYDADGFATLTPPAGTTLANDPDGYARLSLEA